MIVDRTVGRQQLSLLCPEVGSGVTLKDIGIADINCDESTKVCADDCRVTADRNRLAKYMISRAVRGQQLSLLCPEVGGGVSHKDIGRARTFSFVIIPLYPNDCRVAADRNRLTKTIIPRAVSSQQLLLLRPGTSARVTHKDIGRTVVIDYWRPDYCCVATERNGPAELISICAIRGHQLNFICKICIGRKR